MYPTSSAVLEFSVWFVSVKQYIAGQASWEIYASQSKNKLGSFKKP